MNDTSLSIEKRMALMIASRTPIERLRMASSMFDAGKKLMKAGLQNENGLLNDAQLRTQMFLKLYGDSFTQAEIKRIVNTIPNMQLDMDS
jgi:hypothetical protein